MNKDFTYYLSNYLNKYLPLELNTSTHTIRSYKKTFSMLVEYLVNEKKWILKDVTFSNITREIILEFLNYLEVEKNNTIRTRNQRLAAIKSFYQYAMIDNVDSLHNIKHVLSIKSKKYVKPEQDYLTVDEMKILFDSIDTSSKIGKRNLVLLTVLYDTAGRADEITKLKVEDIRFYDGQILLDGKGKQKRLVPIMNEIMTLLQNYLEQNNIKEGYIFHQNNDKRTNFVAKIVESVAKKLSIDKNITPHTFRRSKATHLFEAGVSILYIKELLNHASIQTTEEYLKINNKFKNEAIKKANELLPKSNVPDWTEDESLLNQLLNL